MKVAFERFFHQDALAAFAELALLHQPLDERRSLVRRSRHQDPLARAQPVGLHHHRPIHGAQRAIGIAWRVVHPVERGGGNVMAFQKSLGKDLAALDFRRLL